MEYLEYLKKASEKFNLPLELLQSILKVEKDKQFMRRRHGVYQAIRTAILQYARDGK